MSRRSGLLLAGGAILGLALAGVVWGAVLGVATLLVAVLVSGLVGQLLLGGRADPARILVAGAVGAVLGTVLPRMAGWPALLSIGGVPVFWSVAGAVVVLAALRLSPGARAR